MSTGKADIADVMDQPSPRVFHHEIDRTNGTIATWLYRVKIGTICMYKGQEFVVMGSTTRFLMLTKAINKSAKDTIAEWIDTIAASQ